MSCCSATTSDELGGSEYLNGVHGHDAGSRRSWTSTPSAGCSGSG